jgi:hypothetical protein
MSFCKMPGLFAMVAVVMAMGVARAQEPTDHPMVDPRGVMVRDLNRPVDLTRAWLVKAGDDPEYASPGLDDSGWRVIDVTKPLASYGIVKPDFVWYRTHVHVPAGEHGLAILLREFYGSYQVYVNGVLTGPSTDFPKGGRLSTVADQESNLPDSLIASGDMTIAIRAEVQSRDDSLSGLAGLSVFATVAVGDRRALADNEALHDFRGLTSNTINASLTALILLIALALALVLREEREYVALCVYLVGALGADLLDIWSYLQVRPFHSWTGVPTQLLTMMSILAGMEFARMILRVPRSRWIVVYEWMVGGLMVCASMIDIVAFYEGIPVKVLLGVVVFTTIVIAPLILGLPLFALWIGRRRHNVDALMLSVPLLVRGAFLYAQIGIAILNVTHVIKREFLPAASSQVFYFRWDEVAECLFLLTLLGFLIVRTVRIARAQAELSAELAAAQQVQQLLLSGSSRPTPGFRVETAFHPANQVGGDFFLLSPDEDGSLVAIVGDVSGKGLTAAMRVAMILGVLRRERSREPGMVLGNLNEALLSQSEMGFTTACCVHLSPDGRYVVANAGHIAPYLAGAEMETPAALPLGLAAEQVYEVVRGRLGTGERMLLMSDGVVEARNAAGELYGFERLPGLTLLGAEAIAETAVRFGQEDDITVLSLAVA